MVRVATPSWHLWSDIFAQAPAGHPPLVPVNHKQSIEEIEKCLELLDATISILQKDEALLAEYFPVTCSMRMAMSALNSEFAQLYLGELDGAETRIRYTPPLIRDSC